ncbi:MAG: hypothetical protein AAF772_16935 [Acidobacteriota bacterium]
MKSHRISAPIWIALVAICMMISAPFAFGEECEILRKPTPDGSEGEPLFIPACYFEKVAKNTDGTFEAVIKALPVDDEIQQQIRNHMVFRTVDRSTPWDVQLKMGRCSAKPWSSGGGYDRYAYTMASLYDKAEAVAVASVQDTQLGWHVKDKIIAQKTNLRLIQLVRDRACGLVRENDLLTLYLRGGTFPVGNIDLCTMPDDMRIDIQPGEHLLLGAHPVDLYTSEGAIALIRTYLKIEDGMVQPRPYRHLRDRYAQPASEVVRDIRLSGDAR